MQCLWTTALSAEAPPLRRWMSVVSCCARDTLTAAAVKQVNTSRGKASIAARAHLRRLADVVRGHPEESQAAAELEVQHPGTEGEGHRVEGLVPQRRGRGEEGVERRVGGNPRRRHPALGLKSSEDSMEGEIRNAKRGTRREGVLCAKVDNNMSN